MQILNYLFSIDQRYCDGGSNYPLRTTNYLVQIITNDQTSRSGDIQLTDANGTGAKDYTLACSKTIAPIGYYADVHLTSSSDNPPLLTLNLLFMER